jgi:hypothetical protein
MELDSNGFVFPSLGQGWCHCKGDCRSADFRSGFRAKHAALRSLDRPDEAFAISAPVTDSAHTAANVRDRLWAYRDAGIQNVMATPRDHDTNSPHHREGVSPGARRAVVATTGMTCVRV